MKVIYELEIPEEQHRLKLYQNVFEMFDALCDLDNFVRSVKKEHIEIDIDGLIERIDEILIDSKIGEIS